MLIEKQKYVVGEIVSFKTVTGDEVLGTLVEFTDKEYTINKPCIVVTSPDGIGLLQAMFGLDPDKENLVLRDLHVVFKCHTHDKMKEHYLTVTSAE